MRSDAATEWMRITDEVVSKDCPPCIDALPWRAGERPNVAWQWPCLQLTQVDDDRRVQAAILDSVEGWLGVTVTAPRQTIPGCRALVMDDGLALGQGEAFILGREFAHIRADGSVHAALAPEWGEEILRRGWGQIHPLALYGLIAPQSLLLYAPRDDAERQTILSILAAAYSYACGRVVVRQP